MNILCQEVTLTRLQCDVLLLFFEYLMERVAYVDMSFRYNSTSRLKYQPFRGGEFSARGHMFHPVSEYVYIYIVCVIALFGSVFVLCLLFMNFQSLSVLVYVI